MVMFTVQPGVSYHSVAEVLSNAPRLSVSGWFHAAAPPPGSDTNASLAQLQAARKGGASAAAVPPRALPPLGPALTPKQQKQLATLINPTYLHASTITAVRQQLEEQGAMQLSDFVNPAVAAAISHAARAADRRDGLGGGLVPSYAAGLKRKGWRAIGPPQLQRYLRHVTKGAEAEEAKGAGPLLQVC
eukprot:1668874-Prymnesium_polylepis.1